MSYWQPLKAHPHPVARTALTSWSASPWPLLRPQQAGQPRAGPYQEQKRVGVGAAVHKTRINFSGASSRFLSLSLSLSLSISPFMLPFCFRSPLPLPLPITHMRSVELPRIASFHSFGFSDLIYFICFVWHPQVLPQWYINFVGVSSSQKRRHAAPLILNEQERAANFRRYVYIPTSRTLGRGVVNQMGSITVVIAHTTTGKLYLWPTQVAIINVD